MSIYLLIALIYDATLVAICGYAFWQGGRPERIGAAVSLAASILSSLMRVLHIASWAPAEIIVLAIDLAVTGSFYLLAIRSTRFWPIWAFGFALADIFISFAGVLLPKAPSLAYQSGLGIYAYFALAALAIGTHRLPRDATPDQRRGLRSKREPLLELGSARIFACRGGFRSLLRRSALRVESAHASTSGIEKYPPLTSTVSACAPVAAGPDSSCPPETCSPG